MREHLQPLLIAHEILEVIQDEDADPLLGVSNILQPRFEFFKNGGECVLLNQEEQALLGLAVMIEASQRHAGGAGKIAHGGAFITLGAEDLRGVVEDLSEAPVEASNRRTA